MVSIRGRGKASGIPIEGQLAFAYELRDGTGPIQISFRCSVPGWIGANG
jgi:hypothetical protein